MPWDNTYLWFKFISDKNGHKFNTILLYETIKCVFLPIFAFLEMLLVQGKCLLSIRDYGSEKQYSEAYSKFIKKKLSMLWKGVFKMAT